MNFIKTLSQGLFSPGIDGRIAFFPWGVMGHGYIIEDAALLTKTKIFAFIFYIIAIPLTVAFAVMKWWILLGIVIAAAAVLYWVAVFFLTRGLPRSELGTDITRDQREQAMALKMGTMRALWWCCIFFAGCSLLVLMFGRDIQERLIGGGGIILFGVGIVMFRRMMDIRRAFETGEED